MISKIYADLLFTTIIFSKDLSFQMFSGCSKDRHVAGGGIYLLFIVTLQDMEA